MPDDNVNPYSRFRRGWFERTAYGVIAVEPQRENQSEHDRFSARTVDGRYHHYYRDTGRFTSFGGRRVSGPATYFPPGFNADSYAEPPTGQYWNEVHPDFGIIPVEATRSDYHDHMRHVRHDARLIRRCGRTWVYYADTGRYLTFEYNATTEPVTYCPPGRRPAFYNRPSSESLIITQTENAPMAQNDTISHVCESCGHESTDADEFVQDVGGDHSTYCTDCCGSCDRCGRAFHLDELTDPECGDFDGDTICSTCLEIETQLCDACGSRFDRSDISYCEATDDYRCSECYMHEDDDDDDGDDGEGYPEFVPHPLFAAYRRGVTKSATDTPFGIEIEVETRRDGRRKEHCRKFIESVNAAAKRTLDRSDLIPNRSFVTVGSDGSLSCSYGAEFSFHPFRIEDLRGILSDRDVQDAYEDMTDTDRMRSTRRIGLHVSISERHTTKMARYRMAQVFEVLDTSAHQADAMRMLGRSPSDYSMNCASDAKLKAFQRHPDKSSSVAIRAIANRKIKRSESGTREAYEGRIELRAFRSHHRLGPILARVELANDLYLWAHQLHPVSMTLYQAFASFRGYHEAEVLRRTPKPPMLGKPLPGMGNPRLTKRQIARNAERAGLEARRAESLLSASL